MLRNRRRACGRPSVGFRLGSVTSCLSQVVASAVEDCHRRTSLKNVKLLPDVLKMLSRVKITPPWEVGAPTRVPAAANIKPHPGGGPLDEYFASVSVDDFLLTKV